MGRNPFIFTIPNLNEHTLRPGSPFTLEEAREALRGPWTYNESHLMKLLLDGYCLSQTGRYGQPKAITYVRHISRLEPFLNRNGLKLIQVKGPKNGSTNAHYFLAKNGQIPDCSYCRENMPKIVMQILVGGSR